MSSPHILLIEPFYGGSHKQLLDLITMEIPDHALFTLPAKKWHWRARTAALHFSQVIPTNHNYRVLFCSSVLNLAELVALRPDLRNLKKILYFHENQLVYPVRKQQGRDFQYGYNQILSSLVADVVVFNSQYNRESFLSSVRSFLKLIPDQKSSALEEQIRPKSRVLFFPVRLPPLEQQALVLPNLAKGVMKNCFNKSDSLCNNDENKNMESHTCLREFPLIREQTGKAHFSHGDEDIMPCGCQNDEQTKTDGSHGDGFETGSIYYPDKIHVHVRTQKVFHPHHCLNDSANVACVKVEPPLIPKLAEGVSTSHSTDVHSEKNSKPLHIIWPHRWEHDKDPESFFQVLYRLCDEGSKFTVSVMGEQFSEVPDIFHEARDKLAGHISHWGYQEDKSVYYRALREADVVISTALHEFFGVAILEAVYLGCYPLCPNRLVYPEIFPKTCLYATSQQLYKRLREFCRRPHLARVGRDLQSSLQLDRFTWDSLGPEYKQLFDVDDSDNDT